MCESKSCEHNKHKCKCQIKGFLKACILLLLNSGERYGYTLQQEIIEKQLKEKVDIGSLYRNLRNLEQAGFVSSTWRESSSGPEQRVYMITELGKKQLLNWKSALESEKSKINTFLEMLNKNTI